MPQETLKVIFNPFVVLRCKMRTDNWLMKNGFNMCSLGRPLHSILKLGLHLPSNMTQIYFPEFETHCLSLSLFANMDLMLEIIMLALYPYWLCKLYMIQ